MIFWANICVNEVDKLSPDEAKLLVMRKFPFAGYMDRTYDSYANIARTALKYLARGDRILDFGSGPCDKTAVLQTLGFKCAAYDDLLDDWHKVEGNREKIIAFAKECGIEFYQADGNRLPFVENSFDMVMMHDIIEHLHDSPRDLLNDLVGVIKPGGYLFITVPNAVKLLNRVYILIGKSVSPSYDLYYWYPGGWRGHIREYVKDDLKKLAKYLSLTVVELRGCNHGLRGLPRISRPIYDVLCRVVQGWCDSWLLVARKGVNWVPRRELPRDKFGKLFKTSCPYAY
jgi:SAM-dependent methyltransferase